jgi:N-acetylglucosamine-6-phosphate deacetylase
VLAPGLVDLQVNGAAGHEVGDGVVALDAIDTALVAAGVTSYLATLITGEQDAAALEARAADAASPLAGIHLEGPFLNPDYAGAHRRELLAVPADGLPAAYESPALRLVTLAPELPGALELIAELRRRGVAVALGHSGADAQTVERAIAAGASLVTHLFDAMAQLHHRDPGLAGVALEDQRLSVGLIADGLHVDWRVLRIVRRAAGRRVVLVSDSSPAAAAPPGRYRLGGREIESLPDGSVRDRDGRLAGSSITLGDAVSRYARLAGAPLARALYAASERPARVIGRRALAPGSPADLLLLDADGDIRRVMRHGRWV